MPQGQREQHQPVKSSPSTNIMRLLIHLPLAFVWDSSSGAAVEHNNASSAEGELLPAEVYFAWNCNPAKVTKGLRPREQRPIHGKDPAGLNTTSRILRG